MRKLFQPVWHFGLVLIVQIGASAWAKPFVTARALLATPLDETDLAASARRELNRLLLDPDGFGTRLGDVLTLDPARVSPLTRRAVAAVLEPYNLALGMTAEAVRDYAAHGAVIRASFDDVDAFYKLSTRAKNALTGLGVTTPAQLVAHHTYATLMSAGFGEKTLADIVTFAALAATPLRTAAVPNVIVAEPDARAALLNHPRGLVEKLGGAPAMAERHSVESLLKTLKATHYLKVLLEYAAATGQPLSVSEAERLRRHCGPRLE